MNPMTPKILIVDDEPDLKSLIEAKLRKSIKSNEYEFHFAANGKEALQSLQNNADLSIILTDINMPVMDGLTLLSHLNSLNRPYKAAVVSAYGDMLNIRTAMNKGATDFVAKPIDFVDFELTLRRMITEFNQTKLAFDTAKNLFDLHKELDIAKSIQEAMVPSTFNPFPNFPTQIAARLIPANKVGGDFYDFFPLDKHRLAFLTAAVTGQGLPACLYMIVTKSLLRALNKKDLTQKDLSCLEIIDRLNELLHADNISGISVGAFYGILDLKTGVLKFCNAGHTRPYIIQNGVLDKLGLQEKGKALGLEFPAATPYKEQEIVLHKGDTVLLYTAGITQTENGSETFNGIKLEEILKHSEKLTSQELLDQIVKEVHDYRGELPPGEDLTLFALKFES